jgi:arylsulfatase A-like enzyme
MDVFMGKSNKGREAMVFEATGRTGYRKGNWVMIPPYNGPALDKWVNIELGNSKEYQLYNIKEDLGQKINMANKNKEKLNEMISEFEKTRGIKLPQKLK